MSNEVICIFVDGGNLFHSSKGLGVRIDFAKLQELLTEGRRLLRPIYYGSDANDEGQHRFFDSMRYMGWEVKTLPLRQYERTPIEKGIDVMLVTDMLIGAFRNVYDTAILCSGDKDYTYSVKAIKELGKRVILAGFEHSVSKELRLSADDFISLTQHLDKIKR